MNNSVDINYKERHNIIIRSQQLPLEEKVSISNKFIDSVLSKCNKPAVAWSGGKDSTIALHLVLKKMPDIDVIWVNTGVEFPECISFINEYKKKWSLNFHIAKPESNFWDVTEKYGWPMLGKGSSGYWWTRAEYLKKKGKYKLARATEAAKISAACCRILKEKPMKKLCSSLDIDLIILGNLVSESRQRFLIWAQKGNYYFAKNEKRWKAWVLSSWTEKDILEYHDLNNLPKSEIYKKGHLRNGCWPCLMDIRFKDNKLSILRKSHPKLWKFLIIDKGLGERLIALKLALSEDDKIRASYNQDFICHIVEEKPCFFDSI